MPKIKDKVQELELLSKDKDKIKRNQQGFQDTHSTLKRSYLLIILKEDSHSKGIKYIIKRIEVKNFPWLGEEVPIQTQKAFRTPDNIMKNILSQYYA